MFDKKETATAEVKFTVQNAIKLDPQNPIPIQYGGDSFYIVRGKKYIPFLGRPDNLPSLLLEARLTSTTQNACVQTIAQCTIGDGLIVKDVNNPDTDLVEWMKSVNNDRQSLSEAMIITVDGERSQGNQFIEIVKGELNGKKFLKFYNHSMLYCRLAEPVKEDDPATEVIYSKLFAKRGNQVKLKDARRIPLWSPNELDQKKCWIKDSEGNFRTMIHFKNEVSGVDHYGLPASVAGLRYQVTEGKYAQYNIDNLDNNLIMGGMLIFKSAMTHEEAQKQAKEILMTHVGEGKTGRIAVVSSESGLDAVDFKPFETHQDGSFIESDKRVEEKIIAANSWDPILAGLSRPTGLSDGSKMIRAIYDAKEAVLLKPLRKKLIDKVVSPILKIYADHFGKPEILKYNVDFSSSMPYSFLGDLDPETILTVDEARLLAGKPAVGGDKGGKFLCELKQKQDVSTKPAAEKGANNS